MENNKNEITVNANVESTRTINLDDFNELLNFGKEPMDELRKIAKETAVKIDSKNEVKDIVAPLDNIIKQIDYKEIQELNTPAPENVIKRLISGTKKKKNQILAKYLGISHQTDAIYLQVKKYQTNLETNNSALISMRQKIEENQTKIKEYVEFGKCAIEQLVDEDAATTEKRNILIQKVNDLQYSLLVGKQTSQNITMMLNNNVMLIKKLSSTYTTTLPIVQNQINMFKIGQEQRYMTNAMKAFDEREKDLISMGAQENIQLAKDIIEVSCRTNDDFSRVKDAIETLKNGSAEILQLSQQRAEDCRKAIAEFSMDK